MITRSISLNKRVKSVVGSWLQKIWVDSLINIFDLYSGHCKKLAPEYAGAAAVLAEQSPPQYVAKCDTTENNALGERFEIKGFPTLVFFR